MTAKQYLKQAYRLNELIDSTCEELKQLKTISKSISSQNLSSESVSSSKYKEAKFANAISKIDELEDKLNNEIAEYISLKNEIKERIGIISDDTLRLILQKRYLNFQKWEQIAVDMNITYRWLHELHNRALAQFETQHSNSL